MSRNVLELRIIQIENSTILQYRPRKYVLLNNGHFAKKLSELELAKMILIQRFGEVDVGEIELAVAVSAISVLFTTIKIDPSFMLTGSDLQFATILIHALAFAAFIASSFSAGRLYYTFLLQKFPNIYLEIGLAIDRIPYYYFRLWQRMITSSFDNRKSDDISSTENEIGYLSLLAAFLVVMVLSGVILIFSLAHEISPS